MQKQPRYWEKKIDPSTIEGKQDTIIQSLIYLSEQRIKEKEREANSMKSKVENLVSVQLFIVKFST